MGHRVGRAGGVRIRLAKKLDPERPRAGRSVDTGVPSLIREDDHDHAVAWVNGKRVYLGHDTLTSKLFWPLARPLARKCTLGDIQRAIDGYETFRDMSADEYSKAQLRFRKALSRVRKALGEHGADAD